MFVSDLRHFLDMPDDAPGPARRMAEHLGSIVRAATAAKAGTAWESALPCRRRAGNRPCPGHIAVLRADLPAPIEWRCTSCGDEGVVSGWKDSSFHLRRPGSKRASEATSEVVGTAAARHEDIARAVRLAASPMRRGPRSTAGRHRPGSAHQPVPRLPGDRRLGRAGSAHRGGDLRRRGDLALRGARGTCRAGSGLRGAGYPQS